MRQWMWLLVFILGLSVAGCSTVPQSRETGSTAVIGVLGFQPEGDSVGLYAAAEGRTGAPPTVYQGKGETPAAAVEDLSDSGERPVNCAHVEHVILTQNGAGRLEEVLSYAFQDIRQSTESQLWLVRTDSLAGAFNGEQDPAKRLSVLKSAGKDGRGFRPLTLREAAAAVAAGDALLIPALSQGKEGFAFAGFGLYHEGTVLAWLTGEAALGAGLLMGDTVRWTASVGDRALSLRSTGIQAEPLWDGERLIGAALQCHLEGLRVGGWQGTPEDERILARQTAQAMEAALNIMKKAGADGAGLKYRAGMSSPTKWQALSEQWEEAFPGLVVTISVPVTTAERY